MARRRISNIRGRKSFQRLQGRKPPRSITLIVCEGETEEAYFEVARRHFNLTTAEVVVADNTKGPAPISVVECAEQRAGEQGGYDHIYCVFDRDEHESFNRARARIRELAGRARNRLPIADIVSIPCFEVWVLLHFERTDAPFPDCAAVIARIRQSLPGYQKADDEIARGLMARLPTAMANARWLAARAAEVGGNPFTAVHLLMEHLSGVSQQPTH